MGQNKLYFNPPYKKLYNRTDIYIRNMSGAWKKVVKTAFKYTHFLGKFFRLRSHVLAQPLEYENNGLVCYSKREQAN